jgi:hypothetical protein
MDPVDCIIVYALAAKESLYTRKILANRLSCEWE